MISSKAWLDQYAPKTVGKLKEVGVPWENLSGDIYDAWHWAFQKPKRRVNVQTPEKGEEL